MSLDRLVEEIRSRGEAEEKAILAASQAEVLKVEVERERRITELTDDSARVSDIEAARERTQRVAAAKLRARQKIYEARESRLKQSLSETRELLAQYARSPEYPKVLERMFRYAEGALGAPVRARGRAEDADLLKRIAGNAFDSTPEPIVGGLVVETPDGARQLDLSFDELLRLREDRVRELLT